MKHLLLTTSFLLFTTAFYAQLHVQPNPSSSTDSYVYANDVVLYVHQDVSLEINNNPQTEASIYLRGDAQLIQGDKAVSLNSGDGKLSVWQRGYANAFDYNYWASPVGNPAGLAGNTGFGIPLIYDVRDDGTGGAGPGNLHKTNSTQQPYTTSLNGVASSVLNDFDGTLQISRRWIYTMRATTGYTTWAFIGHGIGLAAGEGFTMKGTGIGAQDPLFENAHDQLYDFRGRPNDGDIPITVAVDVDGKFQETLTGNPYPSALDMAAFLLDTNNEDIEAAAYYWDQNREVNSHYIAAYEGGYGNWIPGGGVIIPGGLGNSGTYVKPVYLHYDGAGTPGDTTAVQTAVDFERRFAPIGQGFMVRGDSTALAPPGPLVGQAIFKNSMRRHIKQGLTTYSQFRNPGGASFSASAGGVVTTPPAPVYAYPTLRFNVEINGTYVRDMVMMFDESKTKGADRGFDGRHPLVIPAGDAFWKLENTNKPFVIQTRPFDVSDVIPLGIRTKNGANSFKIKVVERHNFTQNMFLYDLQNNHYQRLGPNNDAIINYSGGAGTITDRFFIVFRRGVQDSNIPKIIAEMNIDFFQNNRISQLEVYNPEVLDIKTAWVFDMSGKKVIEENNLGKQQRYSFNTANLSSGVYIVVLTTTDDRVVDYKVTVHNKN